jgi:hypothetical protein
VGRYRTIDRGVHGSIRPRKYVMTKRDVSVGRGGRERCMHYQCNRESCMWGQTKGGVCRSRGACGTRRSREVYVGWDSRERYLRLYVAVIGICGSERCVCGVLSNV